MGCSCQKNVKSQIVSRNRLSEIRSNFIAIETKKKEVARAPNRNRFFSLQRKTWIIILDFLPYKDLCQAGQLNK